MTIERIEDYDGYLFAIDFTREDSGRTCTSYYWDAYGCLDHEEAFSAAIALGLWRMEHSSNLLLDGVRCLSTRLYISDVDYSQRTLGNDPNQT